MRSGSAPMRQTRVNPRSKTKARVGEVKADAAAEVRRRSRGICERCELLPATDMHHRVTRARGGPGDAFNLAHLCSECHHVWAHGQNEYPWLVPGSFLRGVYRGPDAGYRARYPQDA